MSSVSAKTGYLTTLCQVAASQFQDPSSQVSYSPFLFSNDPYDSMVNGIDYGRRPGASALVLGISVMRSVELATLIDAAKTGDEDTSLIIIDNSKEVHELWQALKTLFKNPDKQEFLVNLDRFFNDPRTRELYRGTPQLNTSQFEELFAKYPYEKIREIVLDATLIKNSWANVSMAQAFRNVADELDADIFAYPSNVVPFLYDQPEEQSKALTCLEILHPRLLVSTDMTNGRPTRVFDFKDNLSIKIKQQILHDQTDPRASLTKINNHVSTAQQYMTQQYHLPFELYIDDAWRANLVVELHDGNDTENAQQVVKSLGIGDFYKNRLGRMFFAIPSVNISHSSGVTGPQNADVIYNDMLKTTKAETDEAAQAPTHSTSQLKF